MKEKEELRKLLLPQIITGNINDRYVDKVFHLLGMITDSRVMNNKMDDFKICLTDNDVDARNEEQLTNQTISLNNSYSKLDMLQKKIINRTFEIAIANNDIESVKDKYLMEISLLIKKYQDEPY